YIFPSSFFGPDILTPPAGGQTIEAGDLDATFNGTDVAAGATYGLGSVSYSIAPGATNNEIAAIDFSAYPDTSLSDSNFNNIDFTAESGTITVQTASTVPEPATALPLAAALLIGAAFLRKRRIAL
ncbi:MAG: PEP-CTERM sorting domain-containing protein, partial [Bryobacteraceae bacterium]